MGTEELLIFRIQNEIRSLKLKTKTLEQVTIRERLIRLAKTNPNMAEELDNQFMNVLNRRNNDQNETKQPLRKKW
jgi:hypothetical protein